MSSCEWLAYVACHGWMFKGINPPNRHRGKNTDRRFVERGAGVRYAKRLLATIRPVLLPKLTQVDGVQESLR